MQKRFESIRCSRRPHCCCRSGFQRHAFYMHAAELSDIRAISSGRKCGTRNQQPRHSARRCSCYRRQIPRDGPNAGAYSRCKDLAVTRCEKTRLAITGHILLHPRRDERVFWSNTHQPTLKQRKLTKRFSRGRQNFAARPRLRYAHRDRCFAGRRHRTARCASPTARGSAA